MKKEIDMLGKIIWDYLELPMELKKADAIVVFGSHDLRVASYAAEIFLEKWAPKLLFSGGVAHSHSDDLLNTPWDEPEAYMFADVAVSCGVSWDDILIEDRAMNTGENIQYSREVLEKNGIFPKTVIAVQKPYMERRTFASIKKQWPGIDAVTTSPAISYDEYPFEHADKEKLINIMVGDLQRIMIYPQKGYQIPQDIPKQVQNAYKQLVKSGFVEHMIKNDNF